MAKPTKHQLRVHQNRLLGESSLESYKLTAPNLFVYLQLIESLDTTKAYFYCISADKQNLTVYIHTFSHTFSHATNEFKELLPAGIVMERD